MTHNPSDKKSKLLIALEKSLGIITPACKEVGISRQTFHAYYKGDPEFKKKVDEIYEIQGDFVENQLFKKIKEGSERSIMFYMQYKGRKRGYTNGLDITTDGDKINTIRLIEIKKDIEDPKGEDQDES